MLEIALVGMGAIVIWQAHDINRLYTAVRNLSTLTADLMYIAGYKIKDGKIIAPESVAAVREALTQSKGKGPLGFVG